MLQAPKQEKSGHPWLDRRWAPDGHPNYRRNYYRFCTALARYTQPRSVVELGVDQGDCCGHWAFGCPSATVVGVDIHKDWEEPSLITQQTANQFPNFKYVRDWTWNAVPTVAKLAAPIDILFIDSWHEPDYLIRDWNDYHKLLHPGSIVLVDDLALEGIEGVFKQFPGEKLICEQWMDLGLRLGVFVFPGGEHSLPYKPMPFMPEYKGKQ